MFDYTSLLIGSGGVPTLILDGEGRPLEGEGLPLGGDGPRKGEGRLVLRFGTGATRTGEGLLVLRFGTGGRIFAATLVRLPRLKLSAILRSLALKISASINASSKSKSSSI